MNKNGTTHLKAMHELVATDQLGAASPVITLTNWQRGQATGISSAPADSTELKHQELMFYAWEEENAPEFKTIKPITDST